VFQVADRFGARRPFAGGEVHFEISGPGTLVGDNPFNLAASGAVGAVWIKTSAGATGRIEMTATHASLGKQRALIRVRS
jgi:beta-galactosidase